MLFDLLRPAIFRLDPERAHRLTLAALKVAPVLGARAHDPILASTVAGLAFPSPVGLAAGFDKDAEVPGAMLRMGFGFVEVGTLTPLPQVGNPKPRLFRLEEDEGVVNRMGFNNGGQAAALARLSGRRSGVIGVNIGANKDAADRIADYVSGVRTMTPVADYLTVNISSPNTPGLRGLQDMGPLTELLSAIAGVRMPGGPPLFLKVAPDLTPAEVDGIVKAATGRVDALIVANTTVMRFDNLRSPHKAEGGGLSGKPLRGHAYERLRDFRRATGGGIPLIAAGGIDSAEEAYARIRNGASLVQLYSALVYRGPGLAREISDGLARQLRHDGFANVAEAVGVDAV